MHRSTLHENAILVMISGPAGSMNLIIPLYLAHLGHPVPIVGLMLALGSISTLLSRIPSAALYRPAHSRALLLVTLGGGAATFIAFPLMPDLIGFAAILVLNRVCFGLATTFFLARYLDMMGEGTERRRAMGYYGGTQALGYTTSNLLIGALADLVSYTAAWWYGAVFAAIAVLLLLAAAPGVVTRGPRTPEHMGQPGADHATLDRRARVPGPLGWLHSVADPGLWSALNGNAANTIVHNILVAFFPVLAISVGMGATQVGLARGLYSGINAVARPVAGIALRHLPVRRVTHAGIAIQGVLLVMIPFILWFPALMVVFAVSAVARALVVVSNSVQLAEDVDGTRVSRGVATSAYSAAPDASNIGTPVIAGLVANAVTVGPMFVVVALGTLASYAVGEVAIARWRARGVAARSSALQVLSAPPS